MKDLIDRFVIFFFPARDRNYGIKMEPYPVAPFLSLRGSFQPFVQRSREPFFSPGDSRRVHRKAQDHPASCIQVQERLNCIGFGLDFKDRVVDASKKCTSRSARPVERVQSQRVRELAGADPMKLSGICLKVLLEPSHQIIRVCKHLDGRPVEVDLERTIPAVHGAALAYVKNLKAAANVFRRARDKASQKPLCAS